MMARKKPVLFGVQPGVSFSLPSMAVQSELESTLITNILKRYSVTGVLPSCGRVAMPADVFLGGMDFQNLQNVLNQEVIQNDEDSARASAPVEGSAPQKVEPPPAVTPEGGAAPAAPGISTT